MGELWILNTKPTSTNLLDIINYPPFSFHQLSGNRRGEYSIYLGRKLGYRLIINLMKEDGTIIDAVDFNALSEYTKIVFVLEVSKHYE